MLLSLSCSWLISSCHAHTQDLEAVFDPEEKRSRDKLAALARDAEEETAADDGDETEEASDVKKQEKEEEEEDASLLSQEEETGLRKLRVKAKKRTFDAWRSFIQQQMDVIMTQLPVFTHSNYVEVQERVSGIHACVVCACNAMLCNAWV